MKSDWIEYRKLELIDEPIPGLDLKVTLPSRLRKFWDRLVKFIVNGEEPRIWTKTDDAGNLWWCIYDPTTGARGIFGSEAEVRSWLDGRYYR